MASRKAETDQERESGVVDDRPAKRARVEDEDVSEEEGARSAPRVAQASDLYLDTVRCGRSGSPTCILMHIVADKSRQTRF